MEEKTLRLRLADKARRCPPQPGVYYHKNAAGQIIYVGKAVNLRSRVGSYFRSLDRQPAKTQALMAEVVEFDYVLSSNEIEALFYEAEMIRRYQPKYNVVGRHQIRNGLYVRLDLRGPAPSLTLVDQPVLDRVDYYGPYLDRRALRRALNYLRPVFPFSAHRRLPARACLQAHLGLCPGPETAQFDRRRAIQDLRYIQGYLTGRSATIRTKLEQQMRWAGDRQDYELAADLRNRLQALVGLNQRVIFSDRSDFDLGSDQALTILAELLRLPAPPGRIEGIDVSHQSGRQNTASLVVFRNGIAARTDYRRFRLRLAGNNDVGHIREVVRRRFQRVVGWPLPDLLLIDGGKPQVAAAMAGLSDVGRQVPLIGLAKREETIVGLPERFNLDPELLQRWAATTQTTARFVTLQLPPTNPALLLLRQIRDESHRFALSYHSQLKRKRQIANPLLAVAGVGPVTCQRLTSRFGSYQALRQLSEAELATVVRSPLARAIVAHFRTNP